MHLIRLLSHKRSFFVFALLAILMGGCDYLEYLGKKGEIVTEEYSISNFYSVTVEAPYHIHLVQSDENKIVLEGFDYLMSDVLISEDNGILTLDHLQAKYIQKSKKIKATIYSNSFSNFTFNKPVELTNELSLSGDKMHIVFNGGASFSEMNLNLNYQEVSLNLYGLDHVGKYFLGGNCQILNLVIEGSASVLADELHSQTCNLIHKSINSSKVNCEQHLDVHVYNCGDTYFLGDPTISITRISTDGLKPCGDVVKVK